MRGVARAAALSRAARKYTAGKVRLGTWEHTGLRLGTWEHTGLRLGTWEHTGL